MRLLGVGTACLFAVGATVGVLYDPSADASLMSIHVAVALFVLGLMGMVVGLLIVVVVHFRGGDVPPRQ